MEDFSLTDEQLKLLSSVCENNVVIMNGNAGTGKTASSKALINMLLTLDKSFLLLAPTGRAAKVLSGYTKQPASTIHRGLAYNPKEGWGYNEHSKLNCDIVVVDETSMVDIFLMKHLIEAIDFSRTKLLLIGDDAQIPSVSAGNVLYDLLNSEIVPVVSLTTVFRYGKGGLSTVATDVRNGEGYLKKGEDIQQFGEDKSYVFINSDQEGIVKKTVDLYKNLLTKGYKPEDIGVLSCYNKGDYGTIALNKRLQSTVNPREDEYTTYGDCEYRKGDMIIQCVNNYKAISYPDKAQVFISNGEIGRIENIENGSLIVNYDGVKIIYSKDTFSQIKHAFAISCHKSQGGQFKVTILVTPKAHTYMLNSNLLYVGITRSQEKCYHLGETRTVSAAIKKKENFDRRTFLLKLLKNMSKGKVGNNER